MKSWFGMALAGLVGCSPTDSSSTKLPASAADDTATASSGGDDTASSAGDSGAVIAPDDTAEECEGCPPSSVSATIALNPEDWAHDASRTRDNPLKGFMTSYLWGAPVTDFPDQLEFLYIPMKELWSESGETLDEGLEPLMAAAAERNHHVVLRVFVEYPNRPSGLPEHLSESVPCSVYTEHGGGCSPDYDHPDMVAAMVGLIEALGERYDGDPRLGFVQLGLLGFWGEWHTWPHGDWFASDATQTAVLDAYAAAFPTTQLQARYPSSTMVSRSLGFHDDSFAHSTLGDIEWFFYPRMIASEGEDRWQQFAIGGELRPELQSSVFSDDYVLGEYAQDIGECISVTHATYLLNYYAFNGAETGYLGADRDRAEAAALDMGYQFDLVNASLQLSGLDDESVDAVISLELAQSGVAPFYYPLYASLQSEGLPEPVVSGVDVSAVLPGDRIAFDVDLGRVPIEALGGPIEVQLQGPMVQDGQRVLMRTLTPWTESGEPTALQWSVGCEFGGVTHALGDAVAVPGSDCDCRCDVDGTVRDCDGAVCEASTEG